MAIKLDTSTATMTVDLQGSKSAIHVGKHLALLHGTKNAILTSADQPLGGNTHKGPSITIKGSVFLDATAGELDTGDWQFGILQVSTLAVYEFVYAGRMPNEGSSTVNLKSGYTKNPSIDADAPIADDVFDPGGVTISATTTPRTGFNAEFRFTDHPATLVPLKFQNQKTSSPNYLYSARRDEGFVAYFVARQNENAPIQFLSRVGWHAIWHGTFKWTSAASKPTVTMKDAKMYSSTVLLGAPAATDKEFQTAKAGKGPTTNKQDTTASEDAFVNRKSTVYTESSDRPTGLPDDFFK